MTDKYCVIGNPIAHSKSPDIHAAFAAATGQDIAYERRLAPLDGFADTVRDLVAQGYRGANVTVPFKLEAAALATRTVPSSSGVRSESSTSTENSPISSRNSTPPWASEISPGCRWPIPPPIIATDDAPWCGARNGGRRTRPPGGSGTPDTEWMRVAATAVTSSRSGSRPLRRR